MIKLRSGNVCVIGLSEGNLELLRQGRSIIIQAADFGLEGNVEICVMWGQTETDIVRELGLGDGAIAAAEFVAQRAKAKRENMA